MSSTVLNRLINCAVLPRCRRADKDLFKTGRKASGLERPEFLSALDEILLGMHIRKPSI